MGFEKEELDLVLVPAGLLFMLAYHIFFLYRYLYWPHTTFMGYDNNDKRAWVKSIMENKEKGVSAALTVTSSNTTAATYLATISLALCSLIGAWIANSSSNIFRSELIYGDTRASTISIKYMSLLTCFLLAFSCFIQAVRHLVRASYLISNPSSEVPVSSVELAVIRGGELWSLGLRALYFALNLLLWFFGPIPMFVSSIIMVLVPNVMPSVQTAELKLVDWTEKKFWMWQWPILALRSLLGICTLRQLGLTKYPQPNKVKDQTGLQAHFNSPN